MTQAEIQEIVKGVVIELKPFIVATIDTKVLSVDDEKKGEEWITIEDIADKYKRSVYALGAKANRLQIKTKRIRAAGHYLPILAIQQKNVDKLMSKNN